MKYPAHSLLFAGLLLLLGACGEKGNPNADSNPAVTEKAEAIFKALQAEDYDAAVALYGEGFFKTQTREGWRDKLQALQAERGPLREWHLRRSQADTRFSGKFFLYEYTTVHDGNKRLHHLMTFVWPVNEDDIQLLGHKITPWQVGEED